MRTRLLIGAVGIGMALWGAYLAIQVPQVVEFGAWILAGPILHDALLAPFVAAVGFVLKGPVKAGAVVSGILVLIAVPLLWQPHVPVNPGLHDRDYLLGLGIGLGVVWTVVLVVVIWQRARAARKA